ncbi:MAG: hypothetical protein K1Y02_21010 [Candidatus Hydrogenedentes bacterium]|nr:hypothetical protein [Candidatus Hydrogenedentota bacterium]
MAELEGEDVPSSEAFRVALQQLGDAKIARRSFRQTNWTETEHRLLSKYCSSCAPLGKKLTGLCLLSVVIAECAVFFLGANGLKWDDFLQTQYIALNVLSILFAFHFRERCDPRASMGALLIVALAPLLAVPSWWHEYQEDSFNRVRSIVWIVIALCFALFGLFRLVPLWLKIGRVSPPAKLEK